MRDHWTSEDRARLRPHNAKVLAHLLEHGGDKYWFQLDHVATELGLRNGSTVASRLRDIKAETNYSYVRRRVERGLFEYCLIVPDPNPTQLELEVNG